MEGNKEDKRNRKERREMKKGKEQREGEVIGIKIRKGM